MRLPRALAGADPLLGVAAMALAVALAVVGWQSWRLSQARAALAKEQRARAVEVARWQQAAAEQAAQFRATEQEWRSSQHENAVVAEKARAQAAHDLAAAGAAGQRLRERAAALAAACGRAAEDSSVVAAGRAASAPGDVLADVLGRLDEAGRRLAAYADAAAISGEQCAADYQALRRAASP